AFADIDPTAPAADYHAGIGLANAESGIGPRLSCRNDGNERRARIPFRIRAVRLIPDVVAVERRHVRESDRWHRGGDSAAEIGRVELSNRPGAAAPRRDTLPETLA